MHPAFGGFMEDPTAKMAMGFAGHGITAGQQYMEQNVCLEGASHNALSIWTHEANVKSSSTAS